MADRRTFKKAIEHYVEPADDPTNTAHEKLLRAKHMDKSAIFTLNEFDALRKETTSLISGMGTNNESTNKLKKIWERVVPSNTDMFSLKPAEVDTWCEVLKEQSQ